MTHAEWQLRLTGADTFSYVKLYITENVKNTTCGLLLFLLIFKSSSSSSFISCASYLTLTSKAFFSPGTLYGCDYLENDYRRLSSVYSRNGQGNICLIIFSQAHCKHLKIKSTGKRDIGVFGVKSRGGSDYQKNMKLYMYVLYVKYAF